jgi:NTE family protein
MKLLKRKKVGLVLGGGGARGLAHIGVLKVLEENNIPIDFVSGTSIGAIIGALYCLGKKPSEIEEIAKKINWKNIFDFGFSLKGIIKGKKIEDYLRDIFEEKSFSDLKIPFFATAVDINESTEVVFNKGDLTNAVRASISIPGIFKPIMNNGRVLVDGGVLDNLPIKVLKENGAEVIIAVNLYDEPQKEIIYETANRINQESKSFLKEIPNLVKIILKSYNLMEGEKVRLLLENFDNEIIITPKVRNLRIYEFDKVDLLIEKGINSTKKEIYKIKKSVFNKWWKFLFR